MDHHTKVAIAAAASSAVVIGLGVGVAKHNAASPHLSAHASPPESNEGVQRDTRLDELCGLARPTGKQD
jgi:hypothetical protein